MLKKQCPAVSPMSVEKNGRLLLRKISERTKLESSCSGIQAPSPDPLRCHSNDQVIRFVPYSRKSGANGPVIECIR